MANKIVQNLWIVNQAGIVLFNRKYDETVDPQLLGPLMSAIRDFSKLLNEQGMSNLEFSNKSFLFKRKRTILFIGASNIKVKWKKLEQELDRIADKFLTKYSEDVIDNWNQQVSFFNDFEQEIQSSLEAVN